MPPTPTPTPLFSIITVSYNAANTIGTTLRSVDAQTCTDYEHIIVDGASTDKTMQTVADSTNPLRKSFSEPDKGIYDAMNKGMGKASGQYYIFLNAGDAFHSPDTLQHIADAIVKNEMPGVVYGQTNLVDIDGNLIAPRHIEAPEKLTYRSFASGMSVCHQAFVVLARIAPQYNLKFHYSADYDWCIRCLQHSKKNIYVPMVTIDYLSEGMTTRHRNASLWERFKIMSYYYGTIPTIVRHIGFIPRFLSHRHKLKKAEK